MGEEDEPFDVTVEDGIPVTLPSGAVFYVLTESEKRYLETNITRYLTDNHFVNISDLLDIDKLVTDELLIHRWGMWISKGKDYFGDEIKVKEFADLCDRYQTEVRQLKKALGVDKNTRDRMRGDDSIPAYWASLLRRAKEFGYMRNSQFNQAIESMQRIKAIITYHDNSTPDERLEFHCTQDDVVIVIKEEIAKFDKLDEQFRFEQQKAWISDQ